MAIQTAPSLRGGETDAAIQVFKQKASFVLLDCFTAFAMTAFWIPALHLNTPVIATRLQLRAKRGRGEADVAIQNTPSLREGEADTAIQNALSLRGGETDAAIQVF